MDVKSAETEMNKKCTTTNQSIISAIGPGMINILLSRILIGLNCIAPSDILNLLKTCCLFSEYISNIYNYLLSQYLHNFEMNSTALSLINLYASSKSSIYTYFNLIKSARYFCVDDNGIMKRSPEFENDARIIIMPKGVIETSDRLFAECKQLECVVMCNDLLKLEKYTFSGCSSLKYLNIPDSVVYILDSCFENCIELERIVVPDSVEYIGERCFYNCVKLASVKLSENLRLIEKKTFLKCVSLEKIEIPHLVSNLDYCCFRFCTNMTYIKLNNKLQTIGSMAFSYCIRLKKIIIPSNVKYIGNSCFLFCKELKHIKFKYDRYKITNSIEFGDGSFGDGSKLYSEICKNIDFYGIYEINENNNEIILP